MSVAVIGADGQLGQDVCRAFEADGRKVHALGHARIEICDPESVERALCGLGVELIVNTAAMHHVKRCEQQPERAFRVNAFGPRNLAVFARENGATLVHISTDYVFDGSKSAPYTEDDPTAPLNTYGKTKLAGEDFVRSILEKHFILRSSGLFGLALCREKGPNFVETMLRLADERGNVRVVDSEMLTPTSTMELARQIVELSHTERYGLYHATAGGECSWFDFAREIFRQAGVEVSLRVAAQDEFKRKVPRPIYGVLANTGLQKAGLDCMSSWERGLDDYMTSRISSHAPHTP